MERETEGCSEASEGLYTSLKDEVDDVGHGIWLEPPSHHHTYELCRSLASVMQPWQLV